jgi:hypothetical protein
MPVPDFSPGEVLTAAAMDSIGLWLVKTQTIGTAVASVTVTDAFSSDFDSYKIIINGGASSSTVNVSLQLSGSTTGYYHGANFISTAATTTPASGGGSNEAQWSRAGASDANGINFNVDLNDPNLAKYTTYSGVYVFPGVPAFPGMAAGIHQVASAFTGFVVAPGTGTFTGGTIRVYGYRK